jgi:hypothetical protein
MSNLYRGPSIDASYQVSYHLAKRFHLFYFLIQGIILILKYSRYFICSESIKKMSIFCMIFYSCFLFWEINVQIKFKIHSGWMIFGQLTAVGLWNLAKYLVFTTFFSLWFDILTGFLVCECIVMSYQSSLNFVPIERFWANLRTLDFQLWPIPTISKWFYPSELFSKFMLLDVKCSTATPDIGYFWSL